MRGKDRVVYSMDSKKTISAEKFNGQHDSKGKFPPYQGKCISIGKYNQNKNLKAEQAAVLGRKKNCNKALSIYICTKTIFCSWRTFRPKNLPD